MAGTKEGGKNAAATNKERYGSDYYAKIGSIGGKVGGFKGFATNPELAKKAGAKGGKKSKRGPAKHKSTPHLTDEDVKAAEEKKGWTWPFSRNAR